jgi:Flp pilus assembly protein CpaB
VTPEQAEKVNVAAELGKLSLTLRSISGTDGVATASMPGRAQPTGVKPTWAGDVSPALGVAMPPNKVIVATQPPVEVIHGSKIGTVKPQ